MKGKTPTAVHTSRLFEDHENRTTTDRTVTSTDDYQGGASHTKEIVGGKTLKNEKRNLRIDESIEKISEDTAFPLIETARQMSIIVYLSPKKVTFQRSSFLACLSDSMKVLN